MPPALVSSSSKRQSGFTSSPEALSEREPNDQSKGHATSPCVIVEAPSVLSTSSPMLDGNVDRHQLVSGDTERSGLRPVRLGSSLTSE